MKSRKNKTYNHCIGETPSKKPVCVKIRICFSSHGQDSKTRAAKYGTSALTVPFLSHFPTDDPTLGLGGSEICPNTEIGLHQFAYDPLMLETPFELTLTPNPTPISMENRRARSRYEGCLPQAKCALADLKPSPVTQI